MCSFFLFFFSFLLSFSPQFIPPELRSRYDRPEDEPLLEGAEGGEEARLPPTLGGNARGGGLQETVALSPKAPTSLPLFGEGEGEGESETETSEEATLTEEMHSPLSPSEEPSDALGAVTARRAASQASLSSPPPPSKTPQATSPPDGDASAESASPGGLAPVEPQPAASRPVTSVSEQYDRALSPALGLLSSAAPLAPPTAPDTQASAAPQDNLPTGALEAAAAANAKAEASLQKLLAQLSGGVSII